MTKEQQLYEAVETAREKNPNVTIGEVAERLGISKSAYYKYRSDLKKRAKSIVPRVQSKAREVSYERVTETPINLAPMLMVLGTPEQLKHFAAGLYK